MNKPHRDSLYMKLHEAGKLDDLMIFLEDPKIPAKAKNKSLYPYAAEMVTGWGFPCTHAAIRELYRTRSLLWRITTARQTAQSTEELPAYENEISKITSQRTFELLTNPSLDARVLVSLAKLEVQKDALRHNERKFKASLLTKLETAIDALAEEIKANPKACEALSVLHAALKT